MQQRIFSVSGTKASSGDNTLISAPSKNRQIYLTSVFVQNATAVSTTSILKAGSTEIRRVLNKNEGDGLAIHYQPERELALGVGNALVLNLSGANTHNYTIEYYLAQ